MKCGVEGAEIDSESKRSRQRQGIVGGENWCYGTFIELSMCIGTQFMRKQTDIFVENWVFF